MWEVFRRRGRRQTIEDGEVKRPSLAVSKKLKDLSWAGRPARSDLLGSQPGTQSSQLTQAHIAFLPKGAPGPRLATAGSEVARSAALPHLSEPKLDRREIPEAKLLSCAGRQGHVQATCLQVPSSEQPGQQHLVGEGSARS